MKSLWKSKSTFLPSLNYRKFLPVSSKVTEIQAIFLIGLENPSVFIMVVSDIPLNINKGGLENPSSALRKAFGNPNQPFYLR